MRHLIFAILTIGLWLTSAHAEVKALVNGRVLKVSVKPYAPLKPYELWYRQRRDADGDRYGKREFWLNYPTKHEYYSYKSTCDQSMQAGVLELTINLNTINDNAMWAKFNCLKLDYDALTIVYPTLEKFLTPELPQIRNALSKLNEKAIYTDYNVPDYQVKADATAALNYVVNHMFGGEREFAWYNNADFRNALLERTLKEFDKKPYAGNDPIITKPLVLVTHATTVFDNKSIKTFADANIQYAKSRGLPVVYLVSDDGVHDQTWYLADKNPDRAYFSKNGEHSVISTNTVIMMGGFYSECLRTSQLDTITRHFLVSQEALTIHLPVPGIYAHDSIDFTKISKETFLERVKEGSILGGYEVDDNHGGMVESDMNKLTGVPDLKIYTINIFADNTLMLKSGQGSRVVNLKFWSSQNSFWGNIPIK